MSANITCSNCGHTKFDPTHTKGMFQCKKCGSVQDERKHWPKVAGYAIGGALSVLTLGLIPEEAGDAIGEALGNVLGQLRSVSALLSHWPKVHC